MTEIHVGSYNQTSYYGQDDIEIQNGSYDYGHLNDGDGSVENTVAVNVSFFEHLSESNGSVDINVQIMGCFWII